MNTAPLPRTVLGMSEQSKEKLMELKAKHSNGSVWSVVSYGTYGNDEANLTVYLDGETRFIPSLADFKALGWTWMVPEDHENVEALAVLKHREELRKFKASILEEVRTWVSEGSMSRKDANQFLDNVGLPQLAPKYTVRFGNSEVTGVEYDGPEEYLLNDSTIEVEYPDRYVTVRFRMDLPDGQPIYSDVEVTLEELYEYHDDWRRLMEKSDTIAITEETE